MSFRTYWERLIERNGSLRHEDTKMTITVASFKAQIEKAYEHGATLGKKQDDVVDRLRSIFGKKKD